MEWATKRAKADASVMKLLGSAWPVLFLLYHSRGPVHVDDVRRKVGLGSAAFLEQCLWPHGRACEQDLVTTATPDKDDRRVILTRAGWALMRGVAELAGTAEWWREWQARQKSGR